MKIQIPLKWTLFFISVVITQASTSYAFYGKNSAEVKLKFQAQAEVELSKNITIEQLKQEGELRDSVLEQLDFQIQHLMGTFQSESFIKEFGSAGTLSDTYDIELLEVVQKPHSKYKVVKYAFSGNTIFEKSLFKHDKILSIPIKLPMNSETIYDLGFQNLNEYQQKCVDENSLQYDENSPACLNLCTDDHYNTLGDFWYFWDPDKQNCPLKGDTTNVLRVTGTVERFDKFKYTYPEYDKLYTNNDGALDISIFLGYIDDEELNHKKINKKDDGYSAMVEVEKNLKKRGYKRVSQRKGFSTQNGKIGKGISIHKVFEKNVILEGTNQSTKVRVSILLSDTALESPDETFHQYLISAAKTSEIVMYDGHSGLGANLDIESIEGLSLDSKKYQIFFFNGCSSYRYYNYQYFMAKGGSQNLDIVSAGLPTMSDVSGSNILAFLGYFLEGKARTYQKIVQNLETSNGDNDTFLVSVTGDSDNQWKPKK